MIRWHAALLHHHVVTMVRHDKRAETRLLACTSNTDSVFSSLSMVTSWVRPDVSSSSHVAPPSSSCKGTNTLLTTHAYTHAHARTHTRKYLQVPTSADFTYFVQSNWRKLFYIKIKSIYTLQSREVCTNVISSWCCNKNLTSFLILTVSCSWAWHAAVMSWTRRPSSDVTRLSDGSIELKWQVCSSLANSFTCVERNNLLLLHTDNFYCVQASRVVPLT